MVGRPHWIIGIVDSYGAVHCVPLALDAENLHHNFHYPNHFQKRWRFHVGNWNLENSILSLDELSPEDREAIQRAVRKLVNPPDWVLQNDAWYAAGRPRGEAYHRFLRNWERRKRKGLRRRPPQ